jgi:hypothetical protein
MTSFLTKFLSSPQLDLTSGQKAAGLVLKTKMEKFCASTPDQLDPRIVIGDERWGELRIAARAFLETLLS